MECKEVEFYATDSQNLLSVVLSDPVKLHLRRGELEYGAAVSDELRLLHRRQVIQDRVDNLNKSRRIKLTP